MTILKSNPYVKCIVNHSDLEVLARAFDDLIFCSAEKREQIHNQTAAYLRETHENHEGSDLVEVEFHMERDVFYMVRAAKVERLFVNFSPAEHRGLELWKLNDLVLSLPKKYETDMKELETV